MDLEQLSAEARALLARVRKGQAEKSMGLITYDELAAMAREYCAAAYRWQVARFGKAKARRLDHRALLR